MESREGNAPTKGKRGGGGKLSRSETVTVRLDPKLNYLCELAARAQRRTKSSFIEWAIEHALSDVGIPGERSNAGGELATIQERDSQLWDVDEPDRLIALAVYAPSLLTHDEQLIWKLIATSGHFWRGRYVDEADEEVWSWDSDNTHTLLTDRVREHWDEIKQVVEGLMPRSEYFALAPRLVRGKRVGPVKTISGPFDAELDDDSDIPF